MKRTSLFLLACLVFALGVAQGVPARPRYEPIEPPSRAPLALAGTHWFGKCYVDNFWIIFEPNGTITNGYNMNKWNNGTWKLEGNNLYFEMNNKYLQFRGTVTGNIIHGKAWNVNGSRWQTRFSKQEPKN
jgi:hypothetical protein